MTIVHTKIDANAEEYLLSHSQHDNKDMDVIFNSAYRFPEPYMQISKIQATALQFFIETYNIKNIIEVGTFVGFSSFSMAKIIDPIGGSISTIEINKDFYEEAEKNKYDYLKENKNNNAISNLNIINADAKDIFQKLINTASEIDMIFLDGDKEYYSFYLDWAIKYLKSGGYIIIDNALFKGGVVTNKGKYAQSIRRMTEKLKESKVFNFFFLTVGDCMLVARKK